jgi:Zn-dependent alcohol dehydrogenase
MLDLLLVYACVAILSAGIATGTYRTVRRFSGAADSTTFVREMNSIGINATDVAKLVNAEITSLFDLVKKKPNFVQNIGFSKPNAKALLKAAKKLKAFGDGQIKKYKKSQRN